MKAVSVVITACKEEKTLGKTIGVLEKQLPKNSELIVVAPDEPTLKVAKEFVKQGKRIKIFKDPGKGKPTALNLIFKKVKGKILVLTDGDVFPQKKSIKLLLDRFKDPEVGAVSAKVVYLIPKNSLFYEWGKLSEKIYDKVRKTQDKMNKLWHPTGYLYAIKNGIVKQIPSNTLADDALIGCIIKSKGYLIKYEPRARVFVKFPRTIKDFIIQKSRTRAGLLQLKKLFKFRNRTIANEISIGAKWMFRIYGFRKIHKMIVVALIYLIAWLRAYWLFLTKKSFEKIWVRVKSTK